MEDGTVWADDRSVTGTEVLSFDTKDFLFGHACRVVECRVEARKGAFTLYYSFDSGTTWSAGETFGLQANWHEFVSYMNSTTQTVRFRVTSSAREFEMRWIEPWYLPRTRSVVLQSS